MSTETVPQTRREIRELQKTQEQQTRKKTFRGLTSIALLGMGLAQGGLGAIGAYKYNDPFALQREIIGMTLDDGPEKVSDDIRDRLQKAMNTNEASPIEPGDFRAGFEIAQQKAESLGLHLVDSKEYENKVQAAMSPQEIAESVNSYTQQLGFPTTMPQDLDRFDLATQKSINLEPNPGELFTMQFHAANVLRGLSSLPVELYEQVDIRELRLVSTIYSSKNPANNTLGAAQTQNNIIYLDITYDDFAENYSHHARHEVGHLFDRTANWSVAGMTKDDTFRDINPEGESYLDENPQATKTDSFASDYSLNRVVEDKAEIFEYPFVLKPNASNQIDWNYQAVTPIVKEKIIEFYGRIEERTPGLGVFMLKTAPLMSSPLLLNQ